MARTRFVHHPESGFTGRVNGAVFVDGIAEVSGRASLFWFSRHGYKITDQRLNPAPEPNPRTVEEWAAYGVGEPDENGLYPDYRIPDGRKTPTE